MKEEFFNEDLFVALPSKIKSDKIIQNLNDVTIIEKKENKVLVDIFNNEELFFLEKDNLSEEKKYIGVFNNDFISLSNYIFSLHSDNIKDLESYVKVMNIIKTDYNKKELEFIIGFLRNEIQNIDYTKTKKLIKCKRKIRKR